MMVSLNKQFGIPYFYLRLCSFCSFWCWPFLKSTLGISDATFPEISGIPDIGKSVRPIRKPSGNPTNRVYIVEWSGQKSSRGKLRKFCQALVASLGYVGRSVLSADCTKLSDEAVFPVFLEVNECMKLTDRNWLSVQLSRDWQYSVTAEVISADMLCNCVYLSQWPLFFVVGFFFPVVREQKTNLAAVYHFKLWRAF